MPRFETGRHAGVLVPLFSLVSRRGWGIGEIGDIPAFGAWIRAAGHDFVQLLPVTEVAEGETSSYSAITAMAIDPIFISMADVTDFAEPGGESAMSGSARAALDAVRRSPRVGHDEVRALKAAALRAAFDRFMDCGRREAARARGFEEFAAREAWWLDDYARFRAIRRAQAAPWQNWPEPLKRRDPDALAAAERDLAREILLLKYIQWVADDQWRAARARAGVGLFGDLPFMVSGDSADVWARQAEFCTDASIGTPPDAFSEQGQSWGLPAYRWDVVAATDDEWLRQRARRSAALYDGYRIDHLVGFYRTYVRPRSGHPYFTPADERAQRAQGERVLAAFRSADALVIAEDLGVIPDFVRESLAALGVPGYRVLRWEREWHAPGRPFRDPLAWPARSVAASGTHDTTTLAEWWETADVEERRACLAIPALAARRLDPAGGYTPALRDAIVDLLFASGSSYVITPIQDLFGWRDRINVPATIGPHNWTWRLPWPSDQLGDVPEARERADTLRRMSERHGRG